MLIKQKRNKKGRFVRQYRTATIGDKIMVLSALLLFVGIVVMEEYNAFTQPVEAATVIEDTNTIEEIEPKEVRIEVVYNWDREKIIDEIRKAFPETPNTAVAVARCESADLTIDIVGPTSDYGLFQIHKPTWHQTAIELGLEDYATNPISNIKMARYIYNQASGWSPWICYTKGWWKNYL